MQTSPGSLLVPTLVCVSGLRPWNLPEWHTVIYYDVHTKSFLYMITRCLWKAVRESLLHVSGTRRSECKQTLLWRVCDCPGNRKWNRVTVKVQLLRAAASDFSGNACGGRGQSIHQSCSVGFCILWFCSVFIPIIKCLTLQSMDLNIHKNLIHDVPSVNLLAC